MLYISFFNSLEKYGSTGINLKLVKWNSSSFLKIDEARAIFISSFGKLLFEMKKIDEIKNMLK